VRLFMKLSNIPGILSPAAAALPGLLAGMALCAGCGHATSSSQAADLADAAIAPGEPGGASLDATVGAGDAVGDDGADGGANLSDARSSVRFSVPATPTPAPATSPPAETSSTSSAPVTGPQTCGLTPCASGGRCADLTVDRDNLLGSIAIDTRTFSASDCAVAEGCITQTGKRRLLRFAVAALNAGNADIDVGDPTQNVCYQFSACHQHYHFKGVGHYTLYYADGTTVASVGRKVGYCLMDVEPNPTQSPPPATPTSLFSCANQGLHVGWEDVYTADLDCQWVDITGLPAGSYVLSVVVNEEHYLPESNYTNNEARVPVMIPAP
jgi:hypothetical protein